MKKMLFICIVLAMSTRMAYCLDPLRVSVTTTPNVTANLTIDLLQPNGTLISQVYSETGKSSGNSGILSVVLQGGSWAGAEYNKDNLIRIIFNSVVLSIERLDVAIGRQSLYGSNISAEVIDQSDDFSLKSLLLSGDLSVGGTTNMKKLVGNVMEIYIPSSNSTRLDLSNSANSAFHLNVHGNPDLTNDTLYFDNPVEGQILTVHFTDVISDATHRLYFKKGGTLNLNNNYCVFLFYLNSKWHPLSFAADF